YDYNASDPTSLSFCRGDVIQVLNQLESGWWDGVINGVRGWFPSNYCAADLGQNETGDLGSNGQEGDGANAGSSAEEDYDDGHDDDDDVDSEGNPRDEPSILPIEGTKGFEQEEAA